MGCNIHGGLEIKDLIKIARKSPDFNPGWLTEF